MSKSITKKYKLSILNHILEHLKENNIHIDTAHGGWYSGSKPQFVKRHKIAIEYIKEQMEQEITNE